MNAPVVTLDVAVPLTTAYERLVEERLGGAPVVDADGCVVGIVSAQDIFFGSVSLLLEDTCARDTVGARRAPTVADVMTSPAICAREETDLAELARMMWALRLHRVPILRDGRLAGIVSSMDLCRAVSMGAFETVA